jgi:hypothetical protein
LKWSRHELADAARVPVLIVTDYENKGVVTIAHWLDAVRGALEAAGIDFPCEARRPAHHPDADLAFEQLEALIAKELPDSQPDLDTFGRIRSKR